MGDFDIFGSLNNFMKGNNNLDIDDDIEVDETVVAMDKAIGQKKSRAKKRKNEDVELLAKKIKSRSQSSTDTDSSDNESSQRNNRRTREIGESSTSSVAATSAQTDTMSTSLISSPPKKRGRPKKGGDDIDNKLKAINAQYNKVMKTLKADEKKEKQTHLEQFDRHLQQFTQKAHKARNQRHRHSIYSQMNRLQNMMSNPLTFFSSLELRMFNFPNVLDPEVPLTGNSDDEAEYDDEMNELFYAGQEDRDANVELVDLVSSPILNVPGVVNLDSEDEHQQQLKKLQSSAQLNSSIDSENYEISIKIKWHGEIQKFMHRKHQKFGDLIEKLAEREKVEPRFVVLDIHEKIIKPDDTPESIGYTISTFICGRVVKTLVLTPKADRRPAKRDENKVLLKIQSDKWKKPLELSIGKNEKLKILLFKCSEELKCTASKLTLYFDGEKIDLEETPIDLELEGGEIIDCRMT